MREQCIRAVTNALGYEPTQAQLRKIEVRIQRAMLAHARENPAAARAMTPEERLTEAGKRAAQELVAEAKKNVQRVEAAIVAADRIANYRASQVKDGADETGVTAIERMVVHNYDERNGGMISLEERSDAGFELAYTQITDVFDTINPGLWRRLTDAVVHGEPITRGHLRKALTDALHGVTDGVPPEMIAAAKKFHEIAEAQREQFNAAGGVIGKREDWGSSHNWSARLVERAGREQYVEDFTAAAIRDQYVKDDGRYFTEPELRAFFEEAWATIVSDGWTKEPDPSASASGARPRGGAVKANRGSHHRVIHIRPETAFELLSKYSEQNILESMIGTLRRMSRDVAAVEMFGPNPDLLIEQQLEAAVREAAQIDPRSERVAALEARAEHVKNIYDFLAGNNPRAVSRRVADTFATLRNMQVWKLGGAAITSLTDMEGLYKTALQNRLNPVKVMLNSTLAWAPRSRRYARRLGLVLDTMVNDLERISGENINARTLSAKTASGVIRASGLSFVTTARRMGFAVTMMDSIGHLTRQAAYADVTSLHAADYRVLAAKGIDQATWDVWRAASVDTWGLNHTLLTPENIMAVEGVPMEARREAAIRLLSITRTEQDIAVITPGARERVTMRTFFGQTKPGSWGGEIARSVFVFKSFALTLQGRNWQRSGFYHPSNTRAAQFGRYAYMAQMIVTMAALGAVANWVKDLIQFKDPRIMWTNSGDPQERSIVWRNWMQALLSGGGLGVYGDFLFNESSPSSQTSALETLAGPLLGTAAGGTNLLVGNATEALAGEETEFAAEAVRFARGNTPFANLPYVRGLADRVIWNELQDMTDPGAVDRMTDRQYSRQRTEYWWSPSANPVEGDWPERVPDAGRAVGQ